jgi:putative toxin-antitoxin system antitoxin component (TIGR02293 family)
MTITKGHAMTEAAAKYSPFEATAVVGFNLDEPKEAIRHIRSGLNFKVINAVARYLAIDDKILSNSLGIPQRTFSRLKSRDLLNPEQSEKALRLVRIIERTEQVFTDPGAARGWLNTENRALDGARPLELVDTDVGADLVLRTLGRIEQGIFA